MFYFAAVDGTPELNRRALIEAAGRWLGTELEERDYSSWRRVFELLMELGGNTPLVVILDEYQYLRGEPGENVDSALAAVWETYVNKRPRGRPFVLVLCGSIIRVMERLDSADHPLYGRLDWKGKLEPFDYFDAALMAPFPELRDRALMYGMYGGTPRYLSSVDTALSLKENVAQSILMPNGMVRSQVETIISQEHGLRHLGEYNAILAAIGGGATDRNSIAQHTGLVLGSAFRLRLEVLANLKIIAPFRNFAAKQSTPYRYKIVDPALRFYYHIVSKYRNELEQEDARDVWDEHVIRELDAYMGLIFESVAEQAYYRLRGKFKLPMIKEWGNWEGLDKTGRQIEIDIVARTTDGRMVTGAVKWNSKPVSEGLHLESVILNYSRCIYG